MDLYCFVTLLTNRNVDRFLSALLNDKVAVKLIGNDLYIEKKDCIGIVLNLKLSLEVHHQWFKDEKKGNASSWTVRDKIEEKLKSFDMPYFSLIITDRANGAGWNGSNVKYLSKVKEKSTGSPFRDPG